jgi:hypothetical protein
VKLTIRLLKRRIKTPANTQYKTVGVQWFAGVWFSRQLFPTVDRNAARKPNRFILPNVSIQWKKTQQQHETVTKTDKLK